MTMDLKLATNALAGAAGEKAIDGRTDMPSATSTAAVSDEGRHAGSAEACFAAVFAWLMQIAPDAAASSRPASNAGRPASFTSLPSAPAAAQAAPASPGEAQLAADPPLPRAADVAFLARAAASAPGGPAPTASFSAKSTESLLASLPTGSVEVSGRTSGTIDLSFLAAAGASEAPQFSAARELPAVALPPQGPRAHLGTELGQRVVLMVEHGVHDARVKVHPEHLGPLEIRVRVDGDAAQVTFHSAHGAVRDALADAVPRLREMLSAAGLGLEQVDIGANDPSDGGTRDGSVPDDAEDFVAAQARDADSAAEPDGGTSAANVAVKHGLIDTFA